MHSTDVAHGADIVSKFAGMECAHDLWGDFFADHYEALGIQTACQRPMPFELFDCVRWHHEVKQAGMIPTDCVQILVPHPADQHQPKEWANAELQPAYFIEAGTISYLHRVDPDHSTSEADTALFHAVKNTRYLASELSRMRSVSKPPSYNCLATRVPKSNGPVNSFLAAVVFLAQCHPKESVRDSINHGIDLFALDNGVAT